VDLILHLGMADGWEWYAIDKSAWKEGTVKSVDTGRGMGPEVEYYIVPDDIGQTYRDIPGRCPWSEEVPMQLFEGPGIDVDVLAERVEHALYGHGSRKGGREARVEVRPHSDGGNYLCGFISYESAARRFVGGYEAKTMFCHVPGWRDKKRLEVGRDFVCALVGQIAADRN
jgi:pyroglutamyl-peptidase